MAINFHEDDDVPLGDVEVSLLVVFEAVALVLLVGSRLGVSLVLVVLEMVLDGEDSSSSSSPSPSESVLWMNT